MYTYLIVALVIIIACLCIFRHNFANGNIKILCFFILFGAALITTILVNVFHKNALPTHQVELGWRAIALQTVKTDTAYTIKTELTVNGKKVIQSETVKDKPKTGKFDINSIPIKSTLYYDGKLWWNGIDNKSNEIPTTTILVKDKANNLWYKYAIAYIGDHWITSFSLPNKSEWEEIHVKPEVIDSLVKIHPEIAKNWTIK